MGGANLIQQCLERRGSSTRSGSTWSRSCSAMAPGSSRTPATSGSSRSTPCGPRPPYTCGSGSGAEPATRGRPPGGEVGVALEVERPSGLAGDAVAGILPAGPVPVEVSVLELDPGARRTLGHEAHLHLAGVGGIGLQLPGRADVPADHEPLRRIEGEHPCPATLRAVLAAVVDVAAHMGLEHGLGDRDRQQVVIPRLDAVELLGEHAERVVGGDVDDDLSAHPGLFVSVRGHLPAPVLPAA